MKGLSPLRISLALLTLTAFLPQSVAEMAPPARGNVPAVQIRNTVVAVQPAGDPTLDRIMADTSIHEEHRKIAVEVLSLLPAPCRARVQNFYVRYDHPKDRGLAGKDTVILTGNVPANEFRALLVHEALGHVVDLGCLVGTADGGESGFRDGQERIFRNDPSALFYAISWKNSKERKEGSKDADFVSGYARGTDAFEDMAESVTFYFFHREEFRRMAKVNPVLGAKFAWIEAYVFPGTTDHASSTYAWNARSIPWDSTILPYRWISTSTQTAAVR